MILVGILCAALDPLESKAQAQQLTESNEQMAPQAKDAGKSERSLDLIKRRY